ncbi:MAG: diphthamide biosynthesis enzyme Dph2 [archaeon]|nr:diphthamide biosynthesis enzyme Dph2 [archaeon]
MDIDIKTIKNALNKHKAKKAAIQVPEGLKTRALEIADAVEKLGVETVIAADPCFGACDIPDYQMKMLGCDIIIHFGHSQFLRRADLPVVYIEWRSGCDFVSAFKKNISELSGFKKIGLVAAIQHAGCLEKIADILERNGIRAFIGRPKVAGYPGQILGCDLSAAEDVEDQVECFLYAGSGRFHPFGVARITEKPVFCLDVRKGNIFEIDDEKKKYETRLCMKKARFNEAHAVGVLVSVKKGQMRKDVFEIKSKIEKMGKKAYVISMDYISPDKILGMKFDILVNTACPRIEDDRIFEVPVINWDNVDKV